jgi:hypothetical protein
MMKTNLFLFLVPGISGSELGCLSVLSLWQGLLIMTVELSWAPVAHACNPSHSGGRDQEDHSLKPALGK